VNVYPFGAVSDVGHCATQVGEKVQVVPVEAGHVPVIGEEPDDSP
jgi:hypothetical protein